MHSRQPKDPPVFPLKFFRWFCHPHFAEDIEGDLLERFDKRQQQKKAAGWLLTLDVIRLFRPGIIRKFQISQKLNNFSMFKNYFKLSWRSIMRHKTFSLLNILGLSTGLASCLLIMLYVNNELSYDKYNSQYENIYRVVHYYGDESKHSDYSQLAPDEFQVWGNAPIATAMQDYFPEIEKTFRFTSDAPWLFSYKGLSYSENDILFADSTAFQVFDWPFLAGNPETALVKPSTIVLTKRLAEKYFGEENPIGESIIMDNDEPFEVTGVIDVPPNSHFTFAGLVSMSTFRRARPQVFTSWGYIDFYTYFVLKPGSQIESMEAKISEFLASKYTYNQDYYIKFEPLSDAYLLSEAARQPGTTGNMNSIYIFSSIALFILLIACINFMNLSTARSVERAKEVAIRKTIGSHRSSLIYQFLTESVLITFLAALFAGLLVYFGHSLLERLSGKTLVVDWLFDIRYV
ncbi:MAG: ABC transporter permease, partial [Cyclobacteriaceae bacterium]